ncbi:hypothetical protein ABK040_005732 [Willaertia magna]
MYDIVIIGAGHNGLVCASYLKKFFPSFKVCLLEKRHVVGGCAVTEEMVKGFKFSRASYLCSLFRGNVMKDLNLKDKIELLPRNPSSFTPTLQKDQYLFLGNNSELNRKEISKFSKSDATQLENYEKFLEKYAILFEGLLNTPPVDINSNESLFDYLLNSEKNKRVMTVVKELKKLGITNVPTLIEILTGSASKVLDQWFESDILKATLATDSIIGEYCSPCTPGSSYVLLHHVMGDIGFGRGIWAYVKGGMGALTNALKESALELGVEIKTDCEVKELVCDIDTNRCKSVVLKDGTEIKANKAIVSNCDVYTTYKKFITPNGQKKLFTENFQTKLNQIDYSSATFKINLAVNRLPNFISYQSKKEERNERGAGKEHFGTIHFETSIDEIDQSYIEAKSSKLFSNNPVIEMTIPSSLDNSLVENKDHHVIQLFTQYAPYELKEGFEWNDELKRKYVDKVYDKIESYAPGFKQSIIGEDLLSPKDLENTFGIKGGNIFHGSIRLDQLYFNRPFRGFSNYRYFNKKEKEGIKNLFICGSGMHPGGGVMGSCGFNAANIIQNVINEL